MVEGITFLGFDPGYNGAAVALADGRVTIFDTPTLLVGRGAKSAKRTYNIPAAWDIVRQFQSRRTYAVIENVHSMPKQGVASSFSFGKGAMLWEALCVAAGIPFSLVSPQRWKKTILADMGKGKQASVVRCQQLWPKLEWKNSKDGRADAACMAEYARREFLGQSQ